MTERTVFIWEGKDKQGRKTNGEINSTTAAIAKAELRRQGIAPDRVKKKSAGISLNGGAKVNAADIALFTRQMATMMRAGVPLVQSFDIVADGVDKPKLATLIRDIRQDVASGNSFASALKRHPTQFDDLFCNLVDAGELSGALETMLDRIATYKEKTESLKAKVRKAMTYPIAVTIVAFIVSGILLIKVVPQFEQVFQGFGAELPAFTKLVISFSEFAQAYWLAITASLIGAGLAVSSLHRRSKALRDLLDRLSLKLPIAGDIITKSSVCTLRKNLIHHFRSRGYPLWTHSIQSPDQRETASTSMRFIGYATTFPPVNSSIFLCAAPVFSPTWSTKWSPSAKKPVLLDEMLDKSASYYEEQVDNAVDNLTSLMEPVIMGCPWHANWWLDHCDVSAHLWVGCSR